MDKRIVLVGAGSTSFGPSMFTDLMHSKVLGGSTIVLHDINKEHLEIIHDIVKKENELQDEKFKIERTTNRSEAFKGADFIISSIEVGERFKLWRQDYEIPKKHGSTQILGECGGPGGSFHAMRIIPPIIEIVKDAEKICPDAFFINFSNPMARVCLAIKRSVKKLKFCGLCHQIGFMDEHIPKMFDERLRDFKSTGLHINEFRKIHADVLSNLKMTVGGLNHFAFLLGLEDRKTGENLMPKFNQMANDYFKDNEDRYEFSKLTFEVYKRFGFFPYVGDNHLGEYIQFGEEFTETQDMVDWIDRTEEHGAGVYGRVMRTHKRLEKGRYLKKGMLPTEPSDERAIPIIEAIVQDSNTYETAVNIPNDGLIENLPQDLIVEVPATVDKEGVHGIKLGKIDTDIATILRIEASIQDLCVNAIINKSKREAINAIALDPNLGNFNAAELIFNEMQEKQNQFLGYLK